MNILEHLKKFILKYEIQEKPILLALSGGPDSMALAHCLLQIPQCRFAIAHVNHGWRQESGREAADLQAFAAKFSIPWHCLALTPETMAGNLEDACREARREFFVSLCKAHHYAGVMLAHHADDQAETVLKRIFEGASPPAIKGMPETYHLEGVAFWRPFLAITKNDILKWLRQHEVHYFDDLTNRDPTYLRSRMRTQLIPMLSEQFGKEIAKPLCHLADEMRELDAFVGEVIEKEKILGEEGWPGVMINCGPLVGLHPFIVRQVVRKITNNQSLTLSYSQIGEIAHHIAKRSSNKNFIQGARLVRVDRAILFLQKVLPGNDAPVQLEPGKFRWNAWDAEIIPNFEDAPEHLSGWKAAWKGNVVLTLPPGRYILKKGCPAAQLHARGKTLGRWWTENKVPAFMRELVPVIYDGDRVAAEFLGRPEGSSGNGWTIKLTKHE